MQEGGHDAFSGEAFETKRFQERDRRDFKGENWLKREFFFFVFFLLIIIKENHNHLNYKGFNSKIQCF